VAERYPYRGKENAGILAEVGVDAAGKSFAVVGIGVNVNHLPADFPAELSGKAGSLREMQGGFRGSIGVCRGSAAGVERTDAGFGECI
jgi:hypothetical protein